MNDPISLPGDADDVAVQLVAKALRQQRHSLLVKLANSKPVFEELLALRAEAVVVLDQLDVIKSMLTKNQEQQGPQPAGTFKSRIH